jgi:hypothetical protein
MKRTLIALIAGVFAAGAGAGTAAADLTQPPAGPAPQTVAQLAGSSQDAQASATSTQIKPENTNASVRVLSPGDNGPVSQANSSTAAALAANANTLDQSASQTAGGGNPGGYGQPVQTAGQVAASKQDADAWADSTQVKPKNTNVSVRVLSPGDDGDVTQENTSTALGLALNKNDTDQTATQEASGGSPVQAAEQVAKSEQDADASAESTQIEPKNTNVSVRVLSRGDNGSVSQKNSSKAIGVGANLNDTEQTATQTGGGYGQPKQTAGQVAFSKQDADAWADSKQVKPKNTNVSVRVLSDGDDGDVSQENTSTALGIAANKNDTDQTVTQEQGGRYGDVAVQAAGQIASNDQDAWASADSKQIEPENANLSVGTLGHHDGGAVSQRNSSTALAASLNLNKLTQTAAQSQGGVMGGSPEASKKPEPKEDDLESREPEKDEDSVSQLNKSLAAAISANFNHTTQTATQSSQDGKGDVAVQAAGQVASNKQKADSDADSFQLGARNENGRLSGPDLCKHDFCKPDRKDDHCKHDFCKPDRKDDPCKHDPRDCKPHDWDPGKCKPDRGESYGCKHDPRDEKCKPRYCEPDHGKRDECRPDYGKWDHGKRVDCKPDHKPYPKHWPQDMREGMPDGS